MKKALIAIIALGLMAGCAGPIEISQTGTSGGKATAGVPGGDVVNIAIVVEKKDDITEAMGTLGEISNFLPGLADKAAILPIPPTAPVEEIDEPAAVSPAGQGEFEEVE